VTRRRAILVAAAKAEVDLVSETRLPGWPLSPSTPTGSYDDGPPGGVIITSAT